MKFVNAANMTRKAMKEGYAVPAFNTNGATYDIARAALEAAQGTGSPLILQAYEPNLDYRGCEYFVRLASFLCDELNITVPVALQIDHGHSFESAVNAVKNGITSFMFDASHEGLEENIRKTSEVVRFCHAAGVSVEAEVGYVKGNEKPSVEMKGRIPIPESPDTPPEKTRVEEAVEFVKNVNVDMLAVSVGTTHGVYKKQSEIDFKLLRKIRRNISIPLVQHGTCGISLDDISELVNAGMNKINFGEPFRFDYIKYFLEFTDNTEHLWHPWKIMSHIKDKLKENMKDLINAVGSAGKA